MSGIKPAPDPRPPLKIGSRLLICPEAPPETVENRIPLRLGRARAFGSGLHETTASCLEEIEAMPSLAGSRVLDMGCGTGILAIAALLLGAGHAVAFDIDMDAAVACAANARLNGLRDRLGTYCGTLDAVAEGATFDLVMANLYADILLGEVGRLPALIEPGGSLLLSGVGFENAYHLKRELERGGLRSDGTTWMDEYVTMVWKKPVPGVKFWFLDKRSR